MANDVEQYVATLRKLQKELLAHQQQARREVAAFLRAIRNSDPRRGLGPLGNKIRSLLGPGYKLVRFVEPCPDESNKARQPSEGDRQTQPTYDIKKDADIAHIRKDPLEILPALVKKQWEERVPPIAADAGRLLIKIAGSKDIHLPDTLWARISARWTKPPEPATHDWRNGPSYESVVDDAAQKLWIDVAIPALKDDFRNQRVFDSAKPDWESFDESMVAFRLLADWMAKSVSSSPAQAGSFGDAMATQRLVGAGASQTPGKQQKALRRVWVQSRYQALAQEEGPGGEPVYLKQRPILAKLAEEKGVCIRTIQSDISELRRKELLPPFRVRQPREITNRMHAVDPSCPEDEPT